MRLKLSDDDRCAIDLVLEQRAAAASGGRLEHCFGKPSASLQKRVRVVTQLLDVLGRMPATDPPANLAPSTLKYIRRREHEMVPAHPAARRTVTSHLTSHSSAQRSIH